MGINNNGTIYSRKFNEFVVNVRNKPSSALLKMRRTICFYVLVSNVLVLLQGLRTDRASTAAIQHGETNETSPFLIQTPRHVSHKLSNTPKLLEADNDALENPQSYSNGSCILSRSYCKKLSKSKQGPIEVNFRRHETRQAARHVGRSDAKTNSERRNDSRRQVINIRRGPSYRRVGIETVRVKPVVRYDRENRASTIKINTERFQLQRHNRYSTDEHVQENANGRLLQRRDEVNSERKNRRMSFSQQRGERREPEFRDTKRVRSDTRQDISRHEFNQNSFRNDLRNKMQENRNRFSSRLPRRASEERTRARLEELPTRIIEAVKRRCSPSVERNERTDRLSQRNENINKRYRSQETERRYRSQETEQRYRLQETEQRYRSQETERLSRGSVISRSGEINQPDRTVRRVSNHIETARCLFRISRAVSPLTARSERRANINGKSHREDEYNSNTVRVADSERNARAIAIGERQSSYDETTVYASKRNRLNHRVDSRSVGSFDKDIRVQGEGITRNVVRNREPPRVDNHKGILIRSKIESNRIAFFEEKGRSDREVNQRRVETRARHNRAISRIRRRRDDTERVSVTPRLSATSRTNNNVDQRQERQEFRTGQRGIIIQKREYDNDRRELMARGSPVILKNGRSPHRFDARQDTRQYKSRTQRERRHEHTRRSGHHDSETSPKEINLKQKFSLADIPQAFGLKSFFGDVISSVNTGTVSQAVLLVAVGIMGQSFWQKTVYM